MQDTKKIDQSSDVLKKPLKFDTLRLFWTPNDVSVDLESKLSVAEGNVYKIT